MFGARRRAAGRIRLAGPRLAPSGPLGRHGGRRRHGARGPQDRRALSRHERDRQHHRDGGAEARLRPRGRGGGAAVRGRASHRDAEHGADGRQPLGRQPAEGAAGEMAGDRAEAADRRRADARRRRRRAGRDLPAAAGARGARGGAARRLVRPARGAGARRPDRGDRRRPRRRASCRAKARPRRTCCGSRPATPPRPACRWRRWHERDDRDPPGSRRGRPAAGDAHPARAGGIARDHAPAAGDPARAGDERRLPGELPDGRQSEGGAAEPRAGRHPRLRHDAADDRRHLRSLLRLDAGAGRGLGGRRVGMVAHAGAARAP